MKRQKVEARAAVSRVRRAERRVRRLDSRVERAQDRRDKAKEISDRNPEDTDATTALRSAGGKLAAAKVQRNVEAAVRARLVGQSVDSFRDLTNSRQELRELQDKVADAKRENVYGRVERLENAASSAFIPNILRTSLKQTASSKKFSAMNLARSGSPGRRILSAISPGLAEI